MQIEIPYRPQPRQLKAHLATANEVFYGGSAGGGKALRATEVVCTPFGFRQIGSLKVGDTVTAADGRPAKVVGVWPQGRKQLYRVAFRDGVSVEACADHLWAYSVARKGKWKKSGLEWKVATTRQLMNLLELGHRPLIPLCEPVRFTKSYRYDHRLIDPYTLGVLIGDGCVTKAISYVSGDGIVLDGDWKITNRERHVIYRARGATFSALKNGLKKLNLYGKRAEAKFIPKQYLLGTSEDRWALLQGLMDTDGYADPEGSLYFDSTSERLAEDVAFLVRSLGGTATKTSGEGSYKKDGVKVLCKRVYSLYIRLPEGEKAFRLHKKASRCKPKRVKRRIISIEPTEVDEAVCITIDRLDGLFLTKDFIVTHNSAALRWELVDFCIQCPKLLAVLFRRSFPQLLRNHIRPLQLQLPSKVAEWNETNKEFRFFNGSVLVCRHMEHQSDIEDIQGWDIHIAGVDEAAQFEGEMLAYIRSRLRLGDYRGFLEKECLGKPRLKEYLDRLPRLMMASNPGGAGHHYLKENYIDPAPAETEFSDEYGIRKIFIPAGMADNRFLDKNYAVQFSELPEWQKRQLVEGDWNVVPGAYFDCFSAAAHVVSPFTIPAHWQRFRSMDWGYATPFSIGWWAVADETTVTGKDGTEYTFPAGAMIRYREWYGAQRGKYGFQNKGLRMDPGAVARRIVELELAEEISYGCADPAMWRSDGGLSVAEVMAREGVVWQKAANERAIGAQNLYTRIKTGMLYVFDTCESFIKLLPSARSDEKKPEEYVKEGQDHVIDESRYAAMTRPTVQETGYRRHDPKLLPTMDDLLPMTADNWL